MNTPIAHSLNTWNGSFLSPLITSPSIGADTTESLASLYLHQIMPVLAMDLPSISGRRAIANQDILVERDVVNMARVSTDWTTAQVITGQLFRNGPTKHSTSDNVGIADYALRLESTIATLAGDGIPQPARRSRVDYLRIYLNVAKEVIKKFSGRANWIRISANHFGLRNRSTGFGRSSVSALLCPLF